MCNVVFFGWHVPGLRGVGSKDSMKNLQLDFFLQRSMLLSSGTDKTSIQAAGELLKAIVTFFLRAETTSLCYRVSTHIDQLNISKMQSHIFTMKTKNMWRLAKSVACMVSQDAVVSSV